MADLLQRARLLLAAGPYDARPAEIAAVHAALYPEREAVCQTCRGELGRAYYAIKRWAEAQPDFSTSTSSNVKKTTTARFKSDNTIYTPHGLGVAYSNANLTDKAARDIIQNDPDAKGLFETLPGEADEDEQTLTPAQATAEQAAEKATQPALTIPAGFDYEKLAKAMLDEVERRHAEAEGRQDANQAAPQPAQLDTPTPGLTASAGGAEAAPEVKTEVLDNGVEATTGTTEAVDEDHDEDHDEKPVRLSRMGKPQLLVTYRTELGQEPAAELTNDELRSAIAEHRAAQS